MSLPNHLFYITESLKSARAKKRAFCLRSGLKGKELKKRLSIYMEPEVDLILNQLGELTSRYGNSEELDTMKNKTWELLNL